MNKVSVIMSAYNENNDVLKAAIESVLNQTFSDFEFIIVLDNPTNHEMHQCVDEYAQKDPRIKVIANAENIGLTASLNKAIQLASGIYMSRMDADDIMAEDCLQREVDVMEKENLDFVSASKINIDEHENLLGTYINDFSPDQNRRLLPYDNHINHPTILVKLSLVREENGYRDIPSCEDYDLWMRMLIHGCRIRTLPDIMLHRRMRPDGISTGNPYQQYLSKHFIQWMYRKSRKQPKIPSDNHAYEQYISNYDTSSAKKDRFNHAYDCFYQGIYAMKSKHFLQAMLYWGKAVHSDKEIIGFVAEKILYQIRKYIVTH